jgi:hypothetical protein
MKRVPLGKEWWDTSLPPLFRGAIEFFFQIPTIIEKV